MAFYDKYRGATDLDLGDMLLAELKYNGKLAVGLQKRLESPYNRYFDEHGSLSSADMTSGSGAPTEGNHLLRVHSYRKRCANSIS